LRVWSCLSYPTLPTSRPSLDFGSPLALSHPRTRAPDSVGSLPSDYNSGTSKKLSDQNTTPLPLASPQRDCAVQSLATSPENSNPPDHFVAPLLPPPLPSWSSWDLWGFYSSFFSRDRCQSRHPGSATEYVRRRTYGRGHNGPARCSAR
jgi:hypothetical protein